MKMKNIVSGILALTLMMGISIGSNASGSLNSDASILSKDGLIYSGYAEICENQKELDELYALLADTQNIDTELTSESARGAFLPNRVTITHTWKTNDILVPVINNYGIDPIDYAEYQIVYKTRWQPEWRSAKLKVSSPFWPGVWRESNYLYHNSGDSIMECMVSYNLIDGDDSWSPTLIAR